MTLPSRRTLLLTFGATLLIVIPIVRVGGERSYCEGRAAKSDEAAFDPCTMVDFGMTDAVRWSFDSGVLFLVIAAWSYDRDRRQTKRQ